MFPGHIPENLYIKRFWDYPTETTSVEGSLAGKLQHLKLLPVDDDRLLDEAPRGVEFDQKESLYRQKGEVLPNSKWEFEQANGIKVHKNGGLPLINNVVLLENIPNANR